MRDVWGKYFHFSDCVRYDNKLYDYVKIPIERIEDHRELFAIIQKSVMFCKANISDVIITGNVSVMDFLSTCDCFKVDNNKNFWYFGIPFILDEKFLLNNIHIIHDGFFIVKEKSTQQKIRNIDKTLFLNWLDSIYDCTSLESSLLLLEEIKDRIYNKEFDLDDDE